MQTLDDLLHTFLQLKGSDLYISAGIPPRAKVSGRLQDLTDVPLTEEAAFSLVAQSMKPEQLELYKSDREANFAIARCDGRFRVSAFWQQDMPGMVMRRIETQIPTAEELFLPEVLKDVMMAKKGLVLFVGGTGAGKSSTMAALLGHRNRNHDGHILTIEDPIEFVHQHNRSIITQREVGIDTHSFDEALKNALRQAPDVILLGEIRSQETMEFALAFAETGHLCIATLHANNANQALDRIMHLMPEEKHNQLKFDLAFNLRGIIAQQLIPVKGGKGRRGAFEVLLNSPTVADTILKGEMQELKGLMARSREHGMQTFDQALFDLYEQGLIEYDDALAHADSANELRLMIKLQGTPPASASDPGMLDRITVDL